MLLHQSFCVSCGIFLKLLLPQFLEVKGVEMMQEEMQGFMEDAVKKHGIDPDNPQPGRMLFKPPHLSEEEAHSRFLPKAVRCDGCLAVAHQFENHAFPEAERSKKKGAKLKDSEVIDVTEKLCSDGFENYGLKNVDGKNMLSGEGLEADKEAGMMEGGSKWSMRIQQLCKELIETFEEDGIYDLYRNKGSKKLAASLCTSYCKGQDRRKIIDEL